MYYTNQPPQYPFTNFPPPPYNNGFPRHYRFHPTANLSVKDQIREFFNGAAEMAMAVAKGCCDIVKQSVIIREDSYLNRYFGKDSFIGKRLNRPCRKVSDKLRSFFGYLLPEDRDPLHAFSVLMIVFFLVFAVLSVAKFDYKTFSTPIVKRVYKLSPGADRILLPDGRYIAYREQGVSAERARVSIIFPHGFLSSRLAGIPGLKASLLEEFGIRLLTYDLPGFGQSDPHPSRNLQSSASDMSCLAYALGVSGKFWVLGYSTGSMHAWAALRYIPDRVAGAAMFAPWVNPYDSMMNRDEKYGTWGKWTRRRNFMFFLARRFPRILPFLYHRSFLSGKHDHIDKWLSLSLEERDRTIVEHPIYDEYWQRDIEESTRQGNAKPFVEEAVLQVSNWGFSLGDLKLQKKKRGKGILNWLKYLMSSKEEYTGFLGPIHVWQGMDDRVVPPSMTDFVHRVLPGAAVHKLPYEGHFTYFYFCDECHRQIFTILFGTPRGPLEVTEKVNQSYQPVVENSTKDEEDEHEEVTVGDSSTSEENVHEDVTVGESSTPEENVNR